MYFFVGLINKYKNTYIFALYIILLLYFYLNMFRVVMCQQFKSYYERYNLAKYWAYGYERKKTLRVTALNHVHEVV
jgi:hypothetical protein